MPGLPETPVEAESPVADVEFLSQIGSQLVDQSPLHEVVERIVEFISEVVKCDSCFIYLVEGDELVLRASKNPHPEVIDRLKLRMGEGITGWVAQNRKPVAVARNAFQDERFQSFSELPEDRFEAFLSVPIITRGGLVGVINLQHRPPHMHTRRDVNLVSALGFLVGAEIERAKLEGQITELSEQLATRKLVERAKGILQRELGVGEEEAYLTLQRQSRQRRISMKEVAEAIVLSEEVRRGMGDN